MNSKERAKQTRIVQAMFIGFLMCICALGSFIKVPAGDPNPEPKLENLGKIYSIESNLSNDSVKNQLNQVIRECLKDPKRPDFEDGEKFQSFIQKKYQEKYGESIQVNLKSIIEAKPK